MKIINVFCINQAVISKKGNLADKQDEDNLVAN
jgi:hypothetical protein